jgi:hypothetical protein
MVSCIPAMYIRRYLLNGVCVFVAFKAHHTKIWLTFPAISRSTRLLTSSCMCQTYQVQGVV